MEAKTADLKIIDADAHFTEPPDLWTSRVPSTMADKVPVMRTIEGISAWYLGDRPLCHIGGNVLRRTGQGREKLFGTTSVQPWEDVDPASWDPKERLSLLDDIGIHAQILYPNAIGFSSNVTYLVDDEELRSVILSTYNDFFVDVQASSDDRLFPQAILPVWDMDLTLKEMARLHEAGIRGFTVSDKPHTVGLPDLDSLYFAPMWSLGNELGSVFNFHIAGGADPRQGLGAPELIQRWGQISDMPLVPNPDQYFESFGPQRRMAIGACLSFLSNARVIVNFCMSNFFDRYPHVRIVSVESGLGWIPFLLEFMEYHLEEIVTDPAEAALQQRRPTEYFRDHIYATYWFESVGPAKLLEDVGVSNVMVETDIPHPTCLYPDPVERLLKSASGWTDEMRRRVLQDNAAELYHIPLPSTPA